jgi:hypothetical protein
MTQTADIGKAVFTTVLVCRVARTFQVEHNFLPTISVGRDDRNRFLLPRHLSEPNASQTFLPPMLYICLHGRPPDLPGKKVTCLFSVAVCSEDANVALKKEPSLPT